jgi:hypothetical protein
VSEKLPVVDYRLGWKGEIKNMVNDIPFPF